MLRRLVLVLMMCMLPLQMAWAVAGQYCEHESGKAAQHFGHHDHAHKVGGDIDKSGLKGKFDPDCGFHNLAGMQAVPAIALKLPLPVDSNAKVAVDTQLHSISVFQRPDRPKWFAAS